MPSAGVGCNECGAMIDNDERVSMPSAGVGCNSFALPNVDPEASFNALGGRGLQHLRCHAYTKSNRFQCPRRAWVATGQGQRGGQAHQVSMPSAGVGCNMKNDIKILVCGTFQCPRRAWVATAPLQIEVSCNSFYLVFSAFSG